MCAESTHASKPSGRGCVDCLASRVGWWFHLRRCVECGHIGCCDSSPSQHASKHAATTGHPIIASFEPGEGWFYDYEQQGMIQGVDLLPPHSHPVRSARSWPSRKGSAQLGIAAKLAAPIQRPADETLPFECRPFRPHPGRHQTTGYPDRTLAVCLVGALSDLDDVAVRIADVAAYSPYLGIGAVMNSAPRLFHSS